MKISDLFEDIDKVVYDPNSDRITFLGWSEFINAVYILKRIDNVKEDKSMYRSDNVISYWNRGDKVAEWDENEKMGWALTADTFVDNIKKKKNAVANKTLSQLKDLFKDD